MGLQRHQTGSYRHDDDPGEPSTGKPRLSVTDDEAVILGLLAKGKHVLEIGTGLGVSTVMLARAAATVATVDIDPWVHETVWPTLPANVVGLDEVQGSGFDMVFIDGDHSVEATRRDIATAKSVVAPGGLIALHDVQYPLVWEAIDHEEPWQFVRTTHGLGFLWT